MITRFYANPLIPRPEKFENTFDELWKVMFHNFPTENKPPIVIDLYGDNPDDDGVVSNGGVLIQMAVAGYTEEDIKVFTQNGVLYIEGDNTNRDNVPEKFKSKFSRTLPSKNNIDLNKTEVNLTNGILTVSVPFVCPEENRTYLFGKPSKALKK